MLELVQCLHLRILRVGKIAINSAIIVQTKHLIEILLQNARIIAFFTLVMKKGIFANNQIPLMLL